MTKRRGDGAEDEDEDALFFIASATWQGARSGYYFGTTVERGTGYYLDSFASVDATTAVAGGDDTEVTVPPPAAVEEEGRKNNQKKKKRVRIDESANIETTTTTTQLLDDAERRAVGRKVVTLTPAGVVQAGVSLRRAMDHNALLRAKTAGGGGGGAETYMDSEVALYEQIAALKAIAADPANLYGVLLHDDVTTGNNGASSTSTTTTTILDDLMQLLYHENTDIAVAVTSVLLEWLDVDLMVDDESPSLVVLDLATAFLSRRYNLAELLVDNLHRTAVTTNSSSGGDGDDNNNNAEDDDEVGRGTEDILALLENLLDMEQQQQQLEPSEGGRLLETAVILCRDTKLIPWLLDTASSARSMGILSYITSREEAHGIITNWGAIPTTTSATGNGNNNNNKKTTTLDGIEILLQIVARFRKTQPRDADEVELLENTATAMAGILNYGGPASVQAFLDAQGVELVLRCVKEKVYAGYVTLKWLDFSGSGGNANNPVYRLACERAVDAGLFKYVFALFQGKAYPRHYNNDANGASNGTTAFQQKKERKAMNQTIQNTTIRILYALTCHLQPQDEQERRERLVAKFANEKITQRLVDLLLDYDQRVRIAEYNFFKSDLAEEEVDDNHLDEDMVQLAALEAKFAAGGDTLHRLAAIAAFCGAASKSIHASILASLQAKESGVSLIREALLEFLSVLDEASSFKAQLQALVKVLV